MKKSIRNILLIIVGVLESGAAACAQDLEKLFNAATEISTGVKPAESLAGSFSMWGMAAGLVFGSVGFVAFIYGKKNAEAKPMIIGIALMGYPYVVREALAVWAVGIALTAALYFWRD